MSWRLKGDGEIEDLIRGASIVSTGGGLTRTGQSALFSSFDATCVEIRDLSTLPPDSLVCSLYSLGATGSTSLELAPCFLRALKWLEDRFGNPIAALFPVEANIEGRVFQVASQLRLPVIDADSSGGRAVPESTFDNVSVHSESACPVVGATPDGDLVAIEQISSEALVETILRQLSRNTPSGTVAVVDHVMPVSRALRLLTLGTISRSVELGRIVREAVNRLESPLSALCDACNGRVLFEGKVIRSSVAKDTGKGFALGEVEIESDSNCHCTLMVKNEFMSCAIDGTVVCTVPDLLTLIDTSEWRGLHSTEPLTGRRVAAVGIPASPLWRSPRGREVFSPRAVGFEIEQVLLPNFES